VPLKASKFEKGILDLANGKGKSYPNNPIEAGKRWAHAYAVYAADAMSIPPTAAPPASLAAGERVLATALAAVWTSSRTAQQTATGMANALTAFWLTPPVAFGAGLVTAVQGTSALAQALPGIWASNHHATNEQAVKKVAAAVHAFTLTVITTTPFSPSPIVGPIS
jgi:hypothetical protein